MHKRPPPTERSSIALPEAKRARLIPPDGFISSKPPAQNARIRTGAPRSGAPDLALRHTTAKSVKDTGATPFKPRSVLNPMKPPSTNRIWPKPLSSGQAELKGNDLKGNDLNPQSSRPLPVSEPTSMHKPSSSTSSTSRTFHLPTFNGPTKPVSKGKDKAFVALRAPPRPDIVSINASTTSTHGDGQPATVTPLKVPIPRPPGPGVDLVAAPQKPLSVSSIHKPLSTSSTHKPLFPAPVAPPPPVVSSSSLTHKPIPPPPPPVHTKALDSLSPKKLQPISRTSIARLTDVIHNPSSASAELLGLYIQQHGIPEAPVGAWDGHADRVLRLGLEVTPQKAGIYGASTRPTGRGDEKSKGPKFLRGGLADRARQSLSRTSMSLSLWYKTVDTSRSSTSAATISADLTLRVSRLVHETHHVRSGADKVRSRLAACSVIEKVKREDGDSEVMVLFRSSLSRTETGGELRLCDGATVKVWKPWHVVRMGPGEDGNGEEDEFIIILCSRFVVLRS